MSMRPSPVPRIALPRCFNIHKGGGHSIEARGVLARFDPAEDMLTVWDLTADAAQGEARPRRCARACRRSGARDRARGRRRLRAEESVLSGRTGHSRGGAAAASDRSSGSRTAAKVLPPPTTSACRSGTSKLRSARRASCSRSAGISITTTARSRRRAFPRRRTRPPTCSGLTCCPRWRSTSRSASPTWSPPPRRAAPAGRRARS